MDKLTPEREAEIRATAAELGVCAASWAHDASLVGNVTASRIGRLCDAVDSLLAALDATRAELAAEKVNTARALDEARATVDAAFADMMAQRAQQHAEHMAALETLAASVERDARDLALLADVRGHKRLPLAIELLETERDDSSNCCAEHDADAQICALLVRLLRGEG